MKIRCSKCGAEWEIDRPIRFRDECPECAAFLHTCSNCAYCDPCTHTCSLPNTESVRDRQAENFCEEFEFGPPGTGSGKSKQSPPAGSKMSAEEARRRFEALFRDPKK